MNTGFRQLLTVIVGLFVIVYVDYCSLLVADRYTRRNIPIITCSYMHYSNGSDCLHRGGVHAGARLRPAGVKTARVHCPRTVSLPVARSAPPSNTCFLGHTRVSAPQASLDPFSRFCTAHQCAQQTDHRTCNISANRPLENCSQSRRCALITKACSQHEMN